MAAAPGGVAFIDEIHGEGSLPKWPFLLSAVLGNACALGCFLWRYGQRAMRPARAAGGPASVAQNLSGLAPPRQSQLSAIAWKQFYETGSLAILSAGAVLFFTTLYFLSAFERADKFEYGEALAAIAMSAGFMVTLVTGMGVFLDDLKPEIGNFWRSRPVNFSVWFGVNT